MTEQTNMMTAVAEERQIKILLVDDDEMIRKSAGAFLRKMGHEVIFATNGREGLERFEQEGDAVVTGEVSHAAVTAERVFVKSDASEVHVTAGETVRIGGNLTASRLTLGSYDGNRRRIDRCGVVIERAKESAEGVSRRVDHEEKRMDKACRPCRSHSTSTSATWSSMMRAVSAWT